MKSGAIYPFIALVWIGKGLGNANSNIEYFDIKVYFIFL